MNFSELFPEIDRYWSTEMKPARLTVGATTALGIGFCLFAAAHAGSDPGSALFWSSFGLQSLILLGYGTSRTTGCIMTERADRTWDLQRLTPMSSAEFVGGKLFGAPLFAYFLALCLLPWTLIGAGMARTGEAGNLFWCYALLSSAAFLSLSAGLMVSAYADKAVLGGSPATAAALMGFMGLQAATFFISAIRKSEVLTYFGAAVNLKTMALLSMTAFGFWTLAAARWRIGKDLLEGRRYWRLPAFLGFLTVYQLGFNQSAPALALALPCFFCYFVAVLNSETLEHWKRWSLAEGMDWWNEMPGWISASGSCLILAAAVALGARSPAESGLPDVRYPFSQLCFILRDVAFLQWCRFTRSRRPEIMAIVFIALAYMLPGMLLAAFRAHKEFASWFYPLPRWPSVASGAAQAALAIAVLVRRWKTLAR